MSRWRSGIGHAAGTSLKERAVDACPGSRRDERGRQREEGLPKQVGRKSRERVGREDQCHVQSDGCQAERAVPSSTGSRKAAADSVADFSVFQGRRRSAAILA
jgi:hypothetical protein